MPADSELPALPRRWRPLGTRLAGWFLYAALVFISVFAWWALGAEIRGRFNLGQVLTIYAMYAGTGAVVHALTRSRLDATERGLVVVNGYRRREFTWPEALGITMPQGAPWATLDLADGTSVPVMGIQASDGERAKRALREARSLIDG